MTINKVNADQVRECLVSSATQRPDIPSAPERLKLFSFFYNPIFFYSFLRLLLRYSFVRLTKSHAMTFLIDFVFQSALLT